MNYARETRESPRKNFLGIFANFRIFCGKSSSNRFRQWALETCPRNTRNRAKEFLELFADFRVFRGQTLSNRFPQRAQTIISERCRQLRRSVFRY